MELDNRERRFYMHRIERNLKTVNETIAKACERCGRDPQDVKLVGVTKTVGIEEIEILRQLGLRRMGENRVQAAKEKLPQVAALDIEWHMIGHLQTNKVNAALELFQYFHSVDRLKLARAISQRAEDEQPVPILIEVNVSGEQAKHGCSLTDLDELVTQVDALPGVELKGLMTMAPFVEDEKVLRSVFRGLREARDEINERGLTGKPLTELSMGMTNDYVYAVEEGATFVRVGSALFE